MSNGGKILYHDQIDCVDLEVNESMKNPCPECDRERNVGKFRSTKQGMQFLIICEDCDHTMLPWGTDKVHLLANAKAS